jgi:adenylyltransferase/sulfurtransferase
VHLCAHAIIESAGKFTHHRRRAADFQIGNEQKNPMHAAKCNVNASERIVARLLWSVVPVTDSQSPDHTPASAALNPTQFQRYRRHLIMPEIGVSGQRRLMDARVLIVGVGGLGCPAAMYLASAGVGTLGLADADVVSLSNLQRQVLFDTASIGKPKVQIAGERLRAMNPDVRVIEHRCLVTSKNVLELVRDYEIVLDCTDNFPTRYCLNDACVLEKRANIFGSLFRFDGMMTVFAPHLAKEGEPLPCYRCMHPSPPDPGSVPNCAEAGVLGVVPGIIGSLQALEAIKLILGVGALSVGKLLALSSLEMDVRTFRIRANPKCPVCSKHPTITAPIDYEQFCGMPILDPASVSETGATVTNDPILNADISKKLPDLDDRGLPVDYPFLPDWEVTPREVKEMLDKKEDFVFIDCRLPHEVDITKIDGTELIPLQHLSEHLQRLRAFDDKKIVVHCRSGGRSLKFAQILMNEGFEDVKSMAGGILLWNRDINPGGPQY